jgi:hypothetical protein
MNPGSNPLNSDLPDASSSVPLAARGSEATVDSAAADEGTGILCEIVRTSGLGLQRGPDQELTRAGFLQVASTYQDVEFSVSPIVTALVHVALGKLSGVDAAASAQLERFVANSICENRETQSRVRRFWDSLVKTVKEPE